VLPSNVLLSAVNANKTLRLGPLNLSSGSLWLKLQRIAPTNTNNKSQSN